jgi:hypothetical protein
MRPRSFDQLRLLRIYCRRLQALDDVDVLPTCRKRTAVVLLRRG